MAQDTNTKRSTSFAFTYGDKQDDGTWYHSLAVEDSRSYTSHTGIVSTIVWGQLHDTACGDYLGGKHVHGKITFRKSNSSYKLSKNNALQSWSTAMKALYEECKTENLDMYFQPVIKGSSYDAYMGLGKRKASKLDILKAANERRLENGRPNTKEALLHEVAAEDFDKLSSVKDLAGDFMNLQEPDDYLLELPAVADDAVIIQHSKNFVRGLIERVHKSKEIFGLPSYQRKDRELAVLTHLLLMNTFHRRECDQLPALFLMGQAGVGKTSAFFNPRLIHKIPADADGVGRYAVKAKNTTILYEEWYLEKLLEPQNVNLFKQIALGQQASIKVHSRTDRLQPLWVAMTTNDTYETLNEKLTERDPNEASALRRRILAICWDDSPKLSSRLIVHKDIQMCVSLLSLYIFSELAKDPESHLFASLYTEYLKHVYNTRYGADLTWYNTMVSPANPRDRVDINFVVSAVDANISSDSDTNSLFG